MRGGQRTVQVLTGERFGLWRVVREVEGQHCHSGYIRRRVLVECECGSRATVGLHSLRYGATTRCHACMGGAASDRFSVEINGQHIQLRKLLARSGVSQNTFNVRVGRGWSRVEAATTPTGEGRR